MSCCSLRCTVWWAFGVALNAMSVGAIAATFSTVWPLSLALSVSYTSLLFLCIRRFEAKSTTEEDSSVNEEVAQDTSTDEQDATSNSESAEQESPDADAEPNEDSGVDGAANNSPNSTIEPLSKPIPVGLSMLYLVFIFSLAGPGAILAASLVPCYGGNFEKATWHTNASALPKGVQEWDNSTEEADPSSSDPGAAFAQIGEYTYVRGPAGDTPPKPHLVAISGGGSPRKVGTFQNPQWLTAVANEYICFVTKKDRGLPACYYSIEPLTTLWCGTEGEGFKSVELKRGVRPENLIDIDGLLWFQQTYPFSSSSKKYEQANGYAIVSLEPTTMSKTTHSTLEGAPVSKASTGSRSCHRTSFSGSAAVCFLLVAALPMAILSGWIWAKKAIPSSSVALYLSLGLVVMSLFSIGDPYDGVSFFFMWMAVAAPFWLLISSFLLVINSKISHGPLWWSVYFVGIGAFIATISTVVGVDHDAYEYNYDPGLFSTAFLAILVVFLPLALVGILVDSTLIFSLATLGILVDLTMGTGTSLQEQPVVAAVIVVIEIVVIGVAATVVYRRKSWLRGWIVSFLTRCTRRLCGAVPTQDDDKQATDSLLGQDESEEDEML